ncbi:MAG: hypothetical protein C4B56_01475 [Candidatus Methanophagaceae archaeon]|nr:MAG: hypothetical protein C4B56_01475 [Methanophagales archaeon]
MMEDGNKQGIVRWFYHSIPFIVLFLFWELLARVVHDPLTLPPFSAVVVNAFSPSLAYHLGSTLAFSLLGLLIISLVGLPLGMLMRRHKKAEWALNPFFWFLLFASGIVTLGIAPMLVVAYVCVYRHGTDELVSSCLTDNNGSYSLKLPNGVYDVKATSNTGFFNPQSATKTLVINNSNVTLDLKTSMFGFFLFIYFIFFILPSSITGLIIAIVVYAFTKNRKLTVIGFVSGMVTACVSNMWLIDVIEERSLPLSAGIAFIIVAVPIILLSKRKSKVEGGGEL